MLYWLENKLLMYWYLLNRQNFIRQDFIRQDFKSQNTFMQSPEEASNSHLKSPGWLQFSCGLISDLVIYKHRQDYGHIWHWMFEVHVKVINKFIWHELKGTGSLLTPLEDTMHYQYNVMILLVDQHSIFWASRVQIHVHALSRSCQCGSGLGCYSNLLSHQSSKASSVWIWVRLLF